MKHVCISYSRFGHIVLRNQGRWLLALLGAVGFINEKDCMATNGLDKNACRFGYKVSTRIVNMAALREINVYNTVWEARLHSIFEIRTYLTPRFPKPCPRAVRLPKSSSARTRIHTRAVMRARRPLISYALFNQSA